MKKIIPLIICAVCFTIIQPAMAQTDSQKPHSDLYNEVGVGAGPFSMFGGLIVGTVNFFSAIGSTISHEGFKSQYYGYYDVHYYRQVAHWCQVGIKTTMEGGKETRYTDSLCTTIRNINTNLIFTVMPSVRFTYLNRPWVRLYSGADFGLGYFYSKNKDMSKDNDLDDDDDNNHFFPAFNINVFSVNVGKKFYGLFELNVGFDSMVKFGIGARF